ncbi:efflux RND transporter periplasmic adaptor subunit [Reyranella sp. CPCC 100927]|uniref:efflux RND transporter periplasmic adaptor subunit n=1 Tax=Reyranella sp. CPCC 100927 TaxID=2599616 RepID=UPI0015B50DB6|nr:efflux RND transporter periplasmic adaptor subunit [Reyranella sp. CPCC 100927]
MPRRAIFALIGLPVIAAVLVGGWLLWPGSDGESRGAPLTQKVSIGDIEDTVSAVGTLQPREYVDVGTQVSGQLQKIMVDFGAKVEKGQQLAQIDPTVYQAKVSADEAQLQSLKAQLADKQAQKLLADQQLKRQKELLASKATSQDAHDIADANVKIAAAQISMIEAQIQQTESTLNGDRANLNYTKIFAPMSGTVVNITAKQGQTLNANQQAPIILRIADLDPMTVWTQVSEADVPRLKVGMPAYFTTLGQPDRKRFGKLRQVLPTPEVVNNVVLYSSLFEVENPEGDLLPQMSAQVFFVVAAAKQVPLVPVAALRPARGQAADGKKMYRVRVVEGGRIADRTIEVGVINRVVAEVKSGLAAGDEVVISDTPPPAGKPAAKPANARGPRL